MYGLLSLIATLSLSSPLLAAEVTQKDLLVIARTIALVDNGPKGDVKIAVVGGTAESSASAEAFLSLVGNSKTVGNVTLSATQVSPASIATSDAQVVLVPEGVSLSDMEEIFRVAQERKLLTLTTSEDCLNQQKCAIYLKSSPAVDIKMSQSAANATNVKFGSAFRMIIKEVP